MRYTTEQIQTLVRTHYGLEVSVQNLPGEIDLNFYVKTADKQAFTLKIANPDTQIETLFFQHALMQHLHAAQFGLAIPKVVLTQTGAEIESITAPDGSKRLLRMLTWIGGRCLANVNPHSPALMENLGEMCGKLSAALQGFEHPAAHRFLKWDPAQTAWTKDQLTQIPAGAKREQAAYFLQLFEQQALPLFPKLRQSVAYCDANDYNVLVSHDLENPQVPGVIDFGDAVFTHTINDLAIAAAYAAMHKPDPMAVICQLVKGYHRIFPMAEAEAEALFPLIGARLLISVTCSAMNLSENPDNEYLQISDRPAWDLLEKLRTIPPAYAHACIRNACGWEPCPKNQTFQNWVKTNIQHIKPVVKEELTSNETVWLDLSVGSAEDRKSVV